MKVSIVACLTLLLLFTVMGTSAAAPAAPAPTPTPQTPADAKAGENSPAANGGGEEKKPEKIITDGYVPEPVAPGRDLPLNGHFKDAGAWYLILSKVDDASYR